MQFKLGSAHVEPHEKTRTQTMVAVTSTILQGADTTTTYCTAATRPARYGSKLRTASELQGEIGVDSYQLERLELIRIDPNLTRWLARSYEHDPAACGYWQAVTCWSACSIIASVRAPHAAQLHVGRRDGHFHRGPQSAFVEVRAVPPDVLASLYHHKQP